MYLKYSHIAVFLQKCCFEPTQLAWQYETKGYLNSNEFNFFRLPIVLIVFLSYSTHSFLAFHMKSINSADIYRRLLNHWIYDCSNCCVLFLLVNDETKLCVSFTLISFFWNSISNIFHVANFRKFIFNLFQKKPDDVNPTPPPVAKQSKVMLHGF